MKKLNKREIESFISLWDKMSKCYFFNPPVSARQRREYESKHSDEICGVYKETEIKASIETSCSCKNVYCTRDLRIRKLGAQGEYIKKTIPSLKKIIKGVNKNE
jgi:hypothetical protein